VEDNLALQASLVPRVNPDSLVGEVWMVHRAQLAVPAPLASLV